MRMSPAVLHAAQQQGAAIGKPDRGRVEDTVGRIWPVARGQDRIPLVAMEQNLVV